MGGAFSPCPGKEFREGYALPWFTSYVPFEGERRDRMLRDLRCIFHSHARDGLVCLPYLTQMYFGRFSQ